MTTANAAQTIAESVEVGTPAAIGVQTAVECVAQNPNLGAYAAQCFVEALSPNVSPYVGFTNLTVTTLPIYEADRGVSLRYSDDGGANWSNPITQTLGAVGSYGTNLQFRRLGIARNRVIELSWSGNLTTALTGVWVEVTISGT